MTSLERKLEKTFDSLDVSQEDRASITNYLNLLKTKDEATYYHSIRVGLKGRQIAKHMHLDPNALLFPGLLHDVGKLLIDPKILQKTKEFSEKDMKEMEAHSKSSYYLLRGIHDFSAEVVLRHHVFQEEGYPKRLPKSTIEFSDNTKVMIDFYARILALVDFYDAATTRINEKFGKEEKLNKEKVKKIMLEDNSDQEHLINDFYEHGIFGKD